MSTPARKRTAKPPRAPAAVEPATGLSITAPMFRAAKELRRWTDTVLGVAGSAADFSLSLARAAATGPLTGSWTNLGVQARGCQTGCRSRACGAQPRQPRRSSSCRVRFRSRR